MPLGAARLTLLARSSVAVVAEVIRKKVGIQAIGDAQMDTAQSYFGGASALFDGTEDWLQCDNNPIPSSGDFTVEFWFRPSAIGSLRPIWSMRDTGGTHRGTLYINAVGGLTWWTPATNINYGGGNLSANTWYHIACVLDGSTGRIFVNGTGSSASTSVTVGDILEIGAAKYTGTVFGDEVIGHIDEFRISDTARYTADFTAPTAPFVNDDDTKLLLHCDGTDGSTYFDDDNGVGRSAVGVVGNGSIQIDTAQSYFGGSACLAPGSADSLLFDGSLIPLSGDFTIESWVRFTGTASRKMLYSQYTTGTGRTSFEIDADEKAQFFCASQGSFQESDRITSDSALSVDTWYHIAVVRDGSNFTMYIDGVAQADTITHSVNVQDQDFEIFGDDFGTHTDDVWQDEFRISDTARYTSGFTPSTTPFVNDSNTLLLLHMDGTDGSTLFLDDNGATRSRVGVSALGNAQIDTADYKFGGSSLELDGTGDYLVMDSTYNSNFSFTGDFTVECWANADTLGTNLLITNWVPAFWFGYLSSTDFRVYLNNTLVVSGGDPGVGTGSWAHYAVTRSGTDVKIFINGTQLGSTGTASGTINMLDATAIGANYADGSPIQFWDGHIDEVRFSDVARYTAAFTPDTAPFQNDANTLLLLHMDGTDGDTDFVDDNGKESA